ncbi:MAG TPA: VWA domain-containing protein [Thermoanaerobaculia bacterium]|nr:VWA domain-containing protein [Thermoanaerobaculia bacterium]
MKAIAHQTGARRLLSLTLLGMAVLSTAASARQPTPVEDTLDPFADVIEVRVVNLELVVTDRQGRRVPGLQPSDFRLLVDGVETPIDYFSEVRDGVAQPSVEPAASAPGVLASGDVGTSFLVYVDDNRTRKTERDLVVEGLIEDLVLLGPHDRMAVVAQRGPELVMLSSWSSDRSHLEQALRELLDGDRFGGALRSPLVSARRAALVGREQLVDVRQDAPRVLAAPAGFDRVATVHESLAATESRIDLELAVAGAVSTLRGFARPAGRKVMLMLAGDWPTGAFRETGQSLTAITDLGLIRPLVEVANLLGYTLYPVGLDAGTVSVWRNANLAWIARETGGLPLFGRNDVLVDAVVDTRSYYWLGFTPDMAGDDVRHDLRVELKQPGYSVRGRSGYLDFSRSAQLAMMTQSALLFGSELEDEMEIELGRATRWGLRKMDVPLRVRIPLDPFDTLPRGAAEEMRLEVRFAVLDDSGSQADIPMMPLVLRGRPRPGAVHVLETELHMRRQPHDLLVSVHDPLSGATLSARTPVSYRDTQGGKDFEDP